MTAISTNGTLNEVSNTLDVSTGQLLRKSQNPSVAISTTLPYQLYDNSITINTDYPSVSAFTTTTREGTYSEGDEIDFSITFDNDVIVELAPHTVPVLWLKVAPAMQQPAYYSSGSGSNTLTFTYTVTASDEAFHPDAELISILAANYPRLYSLSTSSVAGPIFEPLRIVTGNYQESIRREAQIPILDVDTLSFTASGDSLIPTNISMVGSSPKVISMSALPSSRGDAYTVGDDLVVHITYDQGVRVVVVNNDYPPYIELETGGADRGVAYYDSMTTTSNSDDTLVFKYLVRDGDSLTAGLYLHCGCSDYYNRTFIELNNSRIAKKDGWPYQASTILAHNSTSLFLLSLSSFFL